jgi:hypothetical protein
MGLDRENPGAPNPKGTNRGPQAQTSDQRAQTIAYTGCIKKN